MVSFKLQYQISFLGVWPHHVGVSSSIVIVGWLRYHLLSALSRIIWAGWPVAVVAWLLWSNFYLHTENKQTLHFPLLICLCTEFIGIVLEWYKKGNRIKKQIRFSRSPAIFKIFLSFPVKEELYSSGLSPLPSTERSAFLFIQKNSWKRHFQSFLKVGCFGKCYVMLCAICWRVRREWRGRKPAADCGDTRIRGLGLTGRWWRDAESMESMESMAGEGRVMTTIICL